MIDLDDIEKECQQMIADGLGFIAPKSCGNAEMVAELVAELRLTRKFVRNMEAALNDVIIMAESSGDVELVSSVVGFMNGEFDSVMDGVCIFLEGNNPIRTIQ